MNHVGQVNQVDQDEHVKTAASAVRQSEARRSDHSPLQKCAHFTRFADKTGLCFETEPGGMRMPRGQVTTIK